MREMRECPTPGFLSRLETGRMLTPTIDSEQTCRVPHPPSHSAVVLAVITGGHRGIGRSIALGLARAGAAFTVLARNEEKNSQVLDELKATGLLRLPCTSM